MGPWFNTRSHRDDSNNASYTSQLLLVFVHYCAQTKFPRISCSRVKINRVLISFFEPSSARRDAIDPKPPPIDSFAFMSIYKIGGVVVGVVGRPLEPKRSILAFSSE